jgi:DNA-binding transcriptional LysR family regulator
MSEEKQMVFRLGASHTIGSYILPGENIDTIQQHIDGKIKLTVAPCDKIVQAIKEEKLDLGFIESPILDDELSYEEWLDDELIVCSKKELPLSLLKDDLEKCRLVCREKDSLSRIFIEDFLNAQGLSHESFHTLSEVDNPTAIIQSIKWSRPSASITSVAIVSKVAIEYELKYNDLYASMINNKPIIRKFYILYREESPYIDIIKKISQELME